MKKIGSVKLVVFFTALTVVLTWLVIFAYESFLRGPFYSWVEARYPADRQIQDRIEQRVEHFWISTMVDVIVVSLLLGLVNRQQSKVIEGEKRYRALFEHASDGIGLVSAADHSLVDTNRRFEDILGYNHEAIAGAHVCDLIDLIGDGREHALLSRLCPHGAAEPGKAAVGNWSDEELDLRTRAGLKVTVAASCSLIETGKQRFFMLIIRDVTERKRLRRERQEMERQLFQQSKLASIGELSAGVAHEINNPLNCIMNFAQLIKDDGLDHNETERRMVDGIIEEADRISSIVRNLLTFARQDPHLAVRVEIPQVIRNSISLFGRQFERDGIKLEIETDPDIYPVRADASRLRQVVVNMITNAHHALKTTSGERLFRITARNRMRAGEPVARMEFYDNGPGVPPENRDKIFDPFFTTRRDSGGTGLGLSLSFGIIHDYGGQIWVESEEGSYTRFIIELPAEISGEAEYAQSLAGRRRAEHSLDDGGTAQARRH